MESTMKALMLVRLEDFVNDQGWLEMYSSAANSWPSPELWHKHRCRRWMRQVAELKLSHIS